MRHNPHPPPSCPACGMPQRLCVCAVAPRIDAATRVVVVMHCYELRRPSNSCRALPLILPNAEIRVRGQKGVPFDPSGIVDDPRRTLVLYPSVDSVELSRGFVDALQRPLTLVVPDGSWSQAPRIIRREPALRDLPRVKLPPGPPSAFRLRTQPHGHTVSTFEAVARALGILEGAGVQERMEEFFTVMVERRLWARGKLKAGEVTGGVPPQLKQ